MRSYQRGIFVIVSFLLLNVMFCFSAFAEGDSTQAGGQAQKKQTSSPTSGNTANAEEGWHVGITPYLWFAGMHGTVGALGRDIGFHASFADIFKYLNIGLMGAAEIRHDRVVMPFDIMWIKLSDDKAIPFDPKARSVKAKVTETMLTQKLGFRVVDEEKLKIDALVGIRYWHLGLDLSFDPSNLGFNAAPSANWVDGVAGAKFEFPLSPKAVVTILGDAGNGGAKLDYQVAGVFGYKIKKIMLQAGWRYLDINYRPNTTFVLDAAMSGLVLGVTFNAK